MRRHLERPLTVREVSKLLGWEYEQTRRILKRLNEATHMMLLRREPGGFGQGVRYSVTLSALKKVRPEWFEDTRALGDQVEDLRAEVQVLKKQQEMTASMVGQINRRLSKTPPRISENPPRTPIT